MKMGKEREGKKTVKEGRGKGWEEKEESDP
jgi:hypothetical protein